jgi:DNA replicative helicase MCM subunit Mcm2 (Cdc46/Mcm family)
MTQILVTLDEGVTTQHVRKAIELLRGVVSTTVLKTKDGTNDKTLRQQKYVKESLERAFDEVEQARRGEHKMMTDEEFMNKLKAEGIS